MRWMLVSVVVLAFSGCLPSLYSLKDSEKIPVDLKTRDGKVHRLILIDSDDEKLYGNALITETPKMESKDFGRTYQTISPNTDYTFPKNSITSIHDTLGNDITAWYLPSGENQTLIIGLQRIADVDTRRYNFEIAFSILALAGLVAGFVLTR